MAIDETAVRESFLQALAASRRDDQPYRHWLLTDTLPKEAADAIAALPFPAQDSAQNQGRRETLNSSRVYFSVEAQAEHPVCRAVAGALQHPETVAAIEQTCAVQLTGTNLRIEYCQDTDGFWLEPHTDLGVKKYTMLVYLSTGPDSDSLGTDIYRDKTQHVGASPSPYNGGLIFIPASDTWHGFRKRPIHGVRKSIIVNYVGPDWRARHELAFPDRPVA